MRVRRFVWWLAATVPGAVLFLGLAFLFVYPALFPRPLARPAFSVDPAEGKVWVNSDIVLEVRGHLTEKQVLDKLEFEPPVDLSADDLIVEHDARMPLNETFPWATTRVTINPGRSKLFASDTTYRLQIEEAAASFETITLPSVLSVQADQQPAGMLSDVPTSREIIIVFNEKVEWADSLLAIEPATAFTTRIEDLPDGHSAVRIVPPGRWENSTKYTVRINGPVEDLHGHTGDVSFSAEFTTWAQPRVLGASPQGQSQPVESAIQVQFERDVDRASVESSFHIEPPTAGAFEWLSEQAVAWRPQALQHSAWYTATVGGSAVGGDAIVPHEWSFRTHDPPVFVEILGRQQAPTVLEAVPSGGLGNYALQWNTGQTEHRILFPGPGGQPHNVEVTVTSGDRTVTKAVQVVPAPNNGFTAQQCPASWELIEVSVCYRTEELPGPIRTHLARIDLKDPNIQPRSVPVAEVLGPASRTSEQARARGSLVATNADFFYGSDRGTFTLGPIVWSGNFIYAPASPQTVLALSKDRTPWVGPAGELRFGLHSSDGSVLPLQGVNDIPGENAASLFNAYWGPELTIGAEGCYAVFNPPDDLMRVPEQFGCGAVTGIPLPAGSYIVVGRGAAAEWLRWQSASPLAAFHSFPLPGLDFMVGGSHALIQGGERVPVLEDKRNPRTMAGVDAGGFLYLVVVEGRSEQSAGMNLPEVQAYAANLGLTNAVNLDGGGSSTLVINQAIVNRPSDGPERPVPAIVEVGSPRQACWHAFIHC